MTSRYVLLLGAALLAAHSSGCASSEVHSFLDPDFRGAVYYRIAVAPSFPDLQERRSAEQGEATAQNNLGVMYHDGQGVPQDYAEAVKWYRKAAEQGIAWAQWRLGVMYDQGNGVPQDYAEAMNWYRKAAEQGDRWAQYNLGEMYYDGKGIPQDYAEAVKWYRKAAEQGNAWAQTSLGGMYRDGHSVPQDYALAHFWFNLAAASLPPGDLRRDIAKLRDSLSEIMTPAQIQEAQRMAREWVEQHQAENP